MPKTLLNSPKNESDAGVSHTPRLRVTDSNLDQANDSSNLSSWLVSAGKIIYSASVTRYARLILILLSMNHCRPSNIMPLTLDKTSVQIARSDSSSTWSCATGRYHILFILYTDSVTKKVIKQEEMLDPFRIIRLLRKLCASVEDWCRVRAHDPRLGSSCRHRCSSRPHLRLFPARLSMQTSPFSSFGRNDC